MGRLQETNLRWAYYCLSNPVKVGLDLNDDSVLPKEESVADTWITSIRVLGIMRDLGLERRVAEIVKFPQRFKKDIKLVKEIYERKYSRK